MKKFLKIISAILAVCVTASLFGCNTTKEEPAGGGSGSGNGGGSQTVDPNPPSSSGKEPASPDKDPEDVNDRDKPVVAPTGKEGAISAYNAFVASLANKKFSYDLRTVKYAIDGNIMKVYDDGFSDRFFEKKDDKQYYYAFDKDDNCYYRTEYDTEKYINYFNRVDNMLTSLQGVVWASFEGGVLSGTNGAKSVTYEVANSRNVVTVGAQRMEFHGIGASITLPPWKEKEPEPPAEEKLYDAQGNLNYPLFAETLENWLKESGAFEAFSRKQSKLEKLDYIKMDGANKRVVIGACAIYNQDGSGSYYNAQFPSSAQLYEKLTSQLINTANELTSYLNGLYDSLGKNIMDFIGAVQARDTSLSDKDAKTIVQNILTRLQKVGFKGEDIRNEGKKVDDYADATILSVRKGKDIQQGSAYYMGTVSNANFYITIKKLNGKKEILTVELSYITDGTSQNVLNKDPADSTDKSWMIRNYSSKEIDYTPYVN